MADGTAMSLTPHQARYYALDLVRRAHARDVSSVGAALFDAQVDLNPHQIEAALFGIRATAESGRLLADEVGLGKTIEAALVLSQLWAERRRRLVRGNEQWFTFVDPHGIRMVTDPANEPKLHLWKTLKEIEGRHPGLGVHLDAWILSVTPEHEVSPLLRPFLDHHIVYQDNEGRYLEMLMGRLLGIEGRTVAGAP